MKRPLSLSVCLLIALLSFAHDFEKDGIYYNIISTTEPYTVEVTYRGTSYTSYSDEYTGSVTIPETVDYSDKTYNVKSIGDSAFEDCTSLTSITIPNNVTSIGHYAFYKCSGLTSVTIPNSVTSIGGSAFSGCSRMTSATIPNSVTNIGGGAFYGTAWYDNQPDGLVYAGKVAYKYKGTMPSNTSIAIKDGTLGIAGYAFSDCYGLTSVTIPNSVTSIGNSSFKNCTSLTSITIPNSVTTVGESAFYNCSGLTSVNIPNSVTTIGNDAFYNCSGLTSVTIGNSVTSIGDSAFKGCSGLISVIIPNSVTSIGYYAFGGTAWYDDQPDGVVYAGKVAYLYKGTMPWNTSIAIKDGTLGIAGYAFYNCRGLKSVAIPNSVTNIGERAFEDCSNLTSIEIPNSVTSIGESAFFRCSGLKSVTIPNSMTSIEAATFEGCSGLTSVTIPNSVTSIGGDAFYGCSGLTSITIPNSVTSIGGEAFYKCSSLISVTIPNSVTSIGWRAFGGCYGLTSVTIPNSVTSISDQAFSDCRNLTSVTIPNSVKAIGSHMFDQCFSLASVNIPESVTSIGEYAFFRCSSLKSVTIPNSVTYIGSYAFNACNSLTSITIPNSVTSIGSLAFENTPWYNNQPDGVVYAGKVAYKHKGAMPANTSITIDEGTLGIASSAFYHCINLKSITIPNSVTSIGSSAFYECSGLTEIVSYVQEPFAIMYAWDYVPQNIPLYVPAGSKKKYQSTDGWKHFTNIIEFGGDAIEPTEEAKEVEMAIVPEQIDLNGIVISNTYYALDAEKGDGADKEDGCVVINSITTDEAVSSIVGKDISDESVKDAFKGIVFMVPAGTGKVSVTGQTVGSSSLMVKVGSLPAQAFQLAERETVQIPYTVTEPTYVYIYAGNTGATAARGTATTETEENSVKVYSYKWEPTETTGIEEIDNRQLTIHNSRRVKGIYTPTGAKVSDDAADMKTLPRGIYIVNGKKVAVK